MADEILRDSRDCPMAHLHLNMGLKATKLSMFHEIKKKLPCGKINLSEHSISANNKVKGETVE